MVKKSLRGALALTAALAATGAAYAEGAYEANSQSKVNPYFWTADGILVTPSIVGLPRGNDIPMDSLISGGNITQRYAIDPITLLTGKINFLKNDPRAKEFYTEEARQRNISVYESLLGRISAQKRNPEYSKSLESLSMAVKDGIISKDELEGIAEGVYAIGKQGSDQTVGTYDAPMLVYFPERQTQSVQSTSSNEGAEPDPDSDSESVFPDFYVGLNRQALKIVGLSHLNEHQHPEMSEEKAKEVEKERLGLLARNNYSTQRTQRTSNVPISLVAGARIIVPTFTLQNEQEVKRFALANGLYGGELGIKLGKYFGLTGNISAGLDRRVTDVKELIDSEMFPGIYGITKGDMTRLRSLGVSAEGYIPFSDFFSWLISLGINIQSSTYAVENSKTGPDGQIGVPMLDKPKENRLISLSAATGAELKLSDIVRASALVGAQVPFKEDAKNLDGTWSNNPAGIDFSKITPSLALRIAILLNGGN